MLCHQAIVGGALQLLLLLLLLLSLSQRWESGATS